MSEEQAQYEATPGDADVSANQGSVEKAISGNYQVVIGDVIKEAWGRVSGNKGTIWLAVLIYMVAFMVLSGVMSAFLGNTVDANNSPSPAGGLGHMLVTLLTTPLWVGITFVGVAIASDKPAKSASIVKWYGTIFRLFFTYLLMGLMILLGTVLLVLPGIYLMVAYQMALPLVADKNMKPWEALETSRKAITHKWFTFFGLYLVAAVAIMVSMMFLGIPMIWLLPTFVIASGILYRNTFGAEAASLERAGS